MKIIDIIVLCLLIGYVIGFSVGSVTTIRWLKRKNEF
jgi:hypothetical protein